MWLGLLLLCIFSLFVLVTVPVLTDKIPMVRGRNANLISKGTGG